MTRGGRVPLLPAKVAGSPWLGPSPVIRHTCRSVSTGFWLRSVDFSRPVCAGLLTNTNRSHASAVPLPSCWRALLRAHRLRETKRFRSIPNLPTNVSEALLYPALTIATRPLPHFSLALFIRSAAQNSTYSSLPQISILYAPAQSIASSYWPPLPTCRDTP